jgi:hypothetical protein
MKKLTLKATLLAGGTLGILFAGMAGVFSRR